jgi:hypothetical protein
LPIIEGNPVKNFRFPTEQIYSTKGSKYYENGRCKKESKEIRHKLQQDEQVGDNPRHPENRRQYALLRKLKQWHLPVYELLLQK